MPNITICNLEHKPKDSHSQIAAVGLYIYMYMKLSELLVLDSWYAIEKFHDFISPHHYPWLSMPRCLPRLFHDCGNPEYKDGENCGRAVYRASFNPNLQCFPDQTDACHFDVAVITSDKFCFGRIPLWMWTTHIADWSGTISTVYGRLISQAVHDQFSNLMSCPIFNIIQPCFFGLILRVPVPWLMLFKR